MLLSTVQDHGNDHCDDNDDDDGGNDDAGNARRAEDANVRLIAAVIVVVAVEVLGDAVRIGALELPSHARSWGRHRRELIG